MRIVVIGGNGQLGSDLVMESSGRGHEVVALTHEDVRIEDIDSVRTVVPSLKPDVVLNTAAFHNVPVCEQRPAESYAVNASGSMNLAKVCNDSGASYVYYSTDYVFDGSKGAPYVETDRPNPLNVYATTKLAGEYYALNYCRRGSVIRVSGIYGRVPCRAKGGNFVTTMIKNAKDKPEVRVVDDEVLTPTPTSAIAHTTVRLVETGATGLFHLTCEGECSWYEFAKVIFETLGLRTPLVRCSVHDFPITVRRPFYSVLENSELKRGALGAMPHWREGLATFLRQQYQ